MWGRPSGTRPCRLGLSRNTPTLKCHSGLAVFCLHTGNVYGMSSYRPYSNDNHVVGCLAHDHPFTKPKHTTIRRNTPITPDMLRRIYKHLIPLSVTKNKTIILNVHTSQAYGSSAIPITFSFVTVLSTSRDKLIQPVLATPDAVSALEYARAVVLSFGLAHALRSVARLVGVSVSQKRYGHI